MAADRIHYHRDDFPETISLIEAVRSHRRVPGIRPTEYGVEVSWPEVERSWLSTTEKATMQVARGLATLERNGGAGPLDAALSRCMSAALGHDRPVDEDPF